MPPPEKQGGQKTREIARADIPKPAFGNEAGQSSGGAAPERRKAQLLGSASGLVTGVSLPPTQSERTAIAAEPVQSSPALAEPAKLVRADPPLAPPAITAFEVPVIDATSNAPSAPLAGSAAPQLAETVDPPPASAAPAATESELAAHSDDLGGGTSASQASLQPELAAVDATKTSAGGDEAEEITPEDPATMPAIAATSTGVADERSTVRVWDFATGTPLPPVVSAQPGLEHNDNDGLDDKVQDEVVVVAEETVVPTTITAELALASDTSDAAALTVTEAPVAAADIESATEAADVPELATPASESVPASADRAEPSVAANTARVWDFATGKPLAPIAEADRTARPEVPEAPSIQSAEEGSIEAIETADASGIAAAPVVKAAPDTQPTTHEEKSRVWDFRTGKPLPAVAAASPATAPPETTTTQAAIVQPTGKAHPSPTVIEDSPAWQPGSSSEMPNLTPQDELILEVKVKGVDAADTIIAYGTPEGIYLPLGTLARILDLAVTVSDDGHYAHGWVLDESRPLTIDLRQGLIEFKGQRKPIRGPVAAAFEGELYLRVDQFPDFLPVKIDADLRLMAVLIETLEPFPFQLRAEREANRQRIASRGDRTYERDFERVDLPWVALSVPAADVELRAVSDTSYGPRLEGDLRLAGDLGFLTAEAYLSGESEHGLTASLLELGRVDPDGKLLGPLSATAFSVGDTSTESMPIGLRSVSGRGFAVTNAATQMASVFDRVDLRGILPDGYEVELYRNDILIGSTRDAVNGQYEFLQVPVDFGLNVFRLVFFGPQGQRSESVRRISVGDGRVGKGQLVYNFSAAQKDRNLLGVTPPNFVPQRDYGNWRAGGQLAYGVTSGLTALLSGAWFEREGDRWVSSAGVRTSLGAVAVKADVGAADGGAMAFSGGIGTRIGGSALTLSHAEYTGLFPDETKATGLRYLRRATEVDFNTTLELGNPVSGLVIPLSARVRNYADVDGQNTLLAGVRASTRTSGLLLSNTLEFSRTTIPGLSANNQLTGNFDLATIGRSDTRARLSLGYQLVPDTELTNAGIEIDHALDDRTSLRASASYAFTSKAPTFGASAVRDFDRFSLALDGNYTFSSDAYYVGLRLGFSLGRDPLSRRVYMARPGQATSGGATLRAFQDLDGDGAYGPTDRLLPDVDFIAFNQTATTDKAGIARVGGLGTGREVAIQIDPTSLPDISLAPAKPGVELVPRAGRFHAIDYPVVALSEIEGTASFVAGGKAKGVSGVKLTLTEVGGKVVGVVKTELDGYYFFEQVPPGRYRLSLDPAQAARLNLCPLETGTISVGFEPDVIAQDLEISSCERPQAIIAGVEPDLTGPQLKATGTSN